MKDKDFFVVGIGCSAGGLHALIDFFRQIPENPGVAFVVVQHLYPDYPSKSKEILEKKTALKAQWIRGTSEIEPNCMYVMPENKLIRINSLDQLYLQERPVRPRINNSIDVFFHSLAEAKKDKAIAIVLSGTGSDGAAGAKVIHEAGGMVMVQSPYDAEFSSMPEETIRRDDPVAVTRPDILAEKLLEYVQQHSTFKSS